MSDDLKQAALLTCCGAAATLLLGACYPLMMGTGAFNSSPALTAQYGLIGSTLGFAVANYLRFRRRILARIRAGAAARRV